MSIFVIRLLDLDKILKNKLIVNGDGLAICKEKNFVRYE